MSETRHLRANQPDAGVMTLSEAARVVDREYGTLRKWIDRGWLRTESESPIMVTHQALCDAAWTARYTPQGGDSLALSDDDVRTALANPFGVSSARRAGVQSVAAALLVIAEVSP